MGDTVGAVVDPWGLVGNHEAPARNFFFGKHGILNTLSGAAARADAADAAAKQAARQKELEDEAAGRIAKEKSQADANAARDAARQRQQALTTGALGRADTILTSPLGVLGAPQTAQKKILGG